MKLSTLFTLIRPRQWVKNIFVFAPLFFSPTLMRDGASIDVLLTFISFCLVASGTCCFNDYRDRETDQLHPKKKLRPIAAGNVSPALALLLYAVLSGGGLALALTATRGGWIVFSYFILMSLYTLILKRFAIIDVLTIALGFVLRIEAGAAAAQVQPTVWILVCTGMLALFIALTKRRDDLTQALDNEHRQSLGGYSAAFLDAAYIMVSTALLVSYVVFTTDAGAMIRLGSERLYLTIPFVVAGILRQLQLTMVFKKSGAPTELALTDPFLVTCTLGWIASFASLMYG